MLAPYILPALIFLLASVSVGGLAFAFAPRGGFDPFRARFDRVAGASETSRHDAAPADDSRERKRAIEKTLRELEEKSGSKGNKLTLTGRLRQAGLSWSPRTYYIVCAATAVAIFVVLYLFGFALLTTLGFALAAGLLLPNRYVSSKGKKRLARFSAEFANAVDVIVRGLKAGLPMGDCLRIVATESQEPVRSEFLAVAQDQTLGMPIDVAVQRLRERVPLSEVSFFAIVISIQAKTGGSLSEALGNLSKVLRERRKMAGKIKAMSSEAKTSAWIIAMLPFLVAGAVYVTSPEYMSQMFVTLAGQMVLAGCAVWMGMGVLVMRKMINFDF